MTGHGGQDVRSPGLDASLLVGFKRHLRPTVVPGEAVYLVSHRGVTALHGEHAGVLVPLLDGTRSVQDVLSAAAPALTAQEAEEALRTLDEAGLLRFDRAVAPSASDAGRSVPVDRAAEAYWDLAGLDGRQAAAALAAAAVRIEALGGVDAEPVLAACRECGIRVVDQGEDADLTLVLCDDYLSPQLRDVDAAHRAQGKAWLLAKVGGVDPWIGPLFRPDEGPCWSCLAVRLRGHRRSERLVERALGLSGPVTKPATALAVGRSMAAQSAALEAAKWLAGMRYSAQSAVHTLDTLLLQVSAHPVSRLPQCTACGDPGLVAGRVRAPFEVRSRPKSPQVLGGHRALTAEQTLQRYSHLVDPVTGIVKEIRRSPHSPEFVETYVSGHNLAVAPHTLAGLRAGLRSLSGGKGLTETEARTGALCEAVERYSGTRHGDEPVVWDTYRGLGTAALHPNSCQLYHDRQFRDRKLWNARGSHFQYVSEPFDETKPAEWTPVWSLTDNKQRLLPTSMLYYASAESQPDSLRADSNGNAAGSSLEDALVQGFLELVERDAVALWWYNRTWQAAVDLDSFADPYIERLRDGYRRLNRELWVLDLTSDFGIPVLAALSRRTDKKAEDIIFGFGAHFDPRLALRRALTEMGQLLPAVRNVRPDGTGYAISDPEPLHWWSRATVAGQPYLKADPAQCTRTPTSWTYTPRADLRDDVTAITRLVSAHGMELLVLNQTRPDLELPVVKVIVPGMRHFWARLAPGRLYDVPVALGRLSEPTPYEDLNPIPLFV
ncbi:TOMM precursor leader peptide-binding protein [Streptomyces olivoverticillatus]|uniref:TOMM precursor leader peptide-binding protein n=1 Tax=Streptomyces olivoverticillatus TaxID=66427 RepID=UPI001617729D|nr:TOMM precursor leader peptide-binding protein [Streptomyces olivoverticillatus]